jgi:hypothetical protein
MPLLLRICSRKSMRAIRISSTVRVKRIIEVMNIGSADRSVRSAELLHFAKARQATARRAHAPIGRSKTIPAVLTSGPLLCR